MEVRSNEDGSYTLNLTGDEFHDLVVVASIPTAVLIPVMRQSTARWFTPDIQTHNVYTLLMSIAAHAPSEEVATVDMGEDDGD